jgi:ABC-2 type transport system ATP-binding protein
MDAIVIEHLSKTFGDIPAVKDLSLTVNNEIFGLLGPNGSGKTTTVRILTTLIPPTSGNAWICGCNIFKDSLKVREKISYVPQEMALDVKFTGRENVLFFANMFGIRDADDKVDAVLKVMELSHRADDMVRTYSGGMRRRLELAQALVHEPKVLFLDEPTIGLDVAARKKIWEHIKTLRKNGMTVFVTTHYMDEADQYCDRIAIIDKGAIVAVDTAENLKAELKTNVITVRVSGMIRDIDIPGVSLIGKDDDVICFMADNGKEALPQIARALEATGLTVHSLSLREPTLDDVFLKRVGPYEESGNFNDLQFRNMLRRRA